MHWVGSMEENTWKLVSTFFWTSPHVPFPFADFNLYPFAVIRHNCKYNQPPISVSPFSEPLKVKVVLGASNIWTVKTISQAVTISHRKDMTKSGVPKSMGRYLQVAEGSSLCLSGFQAQYCYGSVIARGLLSSHFLMRGIQFSLSLPHWSLLVSGGQIIWILSSRVFTLRGSTPKDPHLLLDLI